MKMQSVYLLCCRCEGISVGKVQEKRKRQLKILLQCNIFPYSTVNPTRAGTAVFTQHSAYGWAPARALCLQTTQPSWEKDPDSAAFLFLSLLPIGSTREPSSLYSLKLVLQYPRALQNSRKWFIWMLMSGCQIESYEGTRNSISNKLVRRRGLRG